jgi:hypothetical protein
VDKNFIVAKGGFTNLGLPLWTLDFGLWTLDLAAFPTVEDVSKMRDARRNGQCKNLQNHQEILTLECMFARMP